MKTVDTELMIRHLTVEDALYKLDKYINDAFMAHLPMVRIIHGKGEGKLRRAVHEVLSRHSLVKSFHLADYGDGDYGVTIVELYSY
jgi:DNA mismatch repair protein MutS2